MDQAQFDREVAGLRAMGDELVSELQKVDEGSTDKQLEQTAPRSAEEIAETVKAHEAAAQESALAEAKAYAESALAIFKTLAAAGAAA